MKIEKAKHVLGKTVLGKIYEVRKNKEIQTKLKK